MTAPNMATFAASLARSMQNCSLNHHHRPTTFSGAGSQTSRGSSHAGIRGKPTSTSSTSSTTTDETQQKINNQLTDNVEEEDRAVELNSNLSLPYHWEQCLDLKTGEIYYINWRTGMKAKEDPRTTASEYMGDCYYSGEDEDENDSSYDSEESSIESSPSRDRELYNNKESDESNKQEEYHVLVVAGCKSCLMYYMVPKQHDDCPKCNGHLLHFDRSSQTNSP